MFQQTSNPHSQIESSKISSPTSSIPHSHIEIFMVCTRRTIRSRMNIRNNRASILPFTIRNLEKLPTLIELFVHAGYEKNAMSQWIVDWSKKVEGNSPESWRGGKTCIKFLALLRLNISSFCSSVSCEEWRIWFSELNEELRDFFVMMNESEEEVISVKWLRVLWFLKFWWMKRSEDEIVELWFL